jgi:hypothetical protein
LNAVRCHPTKFAGFTLCVLRLLRPNHCGAQALDRWKPQPAMATSQRDGRRKALADYRAGLAVDSTLCERQGRLGVRRGASAPALSLDHAICIAIGAEWFGMPEWTDSAKRVLAFATVSSGCLKKAIMSR